MADSQRHLPARDPHLPTFFATRTIPPPATCDCCSRACFVLSVIFSAPSVVVVLTSHEQTETQGCSATALNT